MTENIMLPYYYEGKNYSRRLLLYRILLYFCLAMFFLPAATPLVRADSGNPQPGSGWSPMDSPNGDSFYKYTEFTVSLPYYPGTTTYKYKMEVWFWQYTGEDYAYYRDYYIWVVGVYLISGSGIAQESQINVYSNIYETDTGSHATSAVWTDASPDSGTYGDNQITISLTVPTGIADFGVEYTETLPDVQITHESRPSYNPYILYKFKQKSLSPPYKSAFGSTKDDHWMLLFTLPDESHDGNINAPPIDGETTVYVDIYLPYAPSRYYYESYHYAGGAHIDWNLYDLG